MRRPSYRRQLDEHGHPVADSDAEAESADGEEELDEDDEDYWLYNKLSEKV